MSDVRKKSSWPTSECTGNTSVSSNGCKETYNCEVVTFTAEPRPGQKRSSRHVAKAQANGRQGIYIDDTA